MVGSKKTKWLLVLILIVLAAVIWLEVDTHFVQQWVASAVYDNRVNFLSCEELPALSEVQRALEQHPEVVQAIKNIDPENIEITIDSSCPEKGSLVIYYPSHNDRIQIEELLGDSFFGIPYQGINR